MAIVPFFMEIITTDCLCAEYLESKKQQLHLQRSPAFCCMLNACKGNLLAAPLPWISIVHRTCYVMHIIAFLFPHAAAWICLD
jgi:hypothetical protein